MAGAGGRAPARLLEAGLVGGPLRELRVAVPNRPGVIAEIALTLGRAGINISDMALARRRTTARARSRCGCADGRADEAAGLVGDLGFAVIA